MKFLLNATVSNALQLTEIPLLFSSTALQIVSVLVISVVRFHVTSYRHRSFFLWTKPVQRTENLQQQ